MTLLRGGFILHDAYLSADAQRVLLSDIRAVAKAAPLSRPMTPWGKPMSVAMTSVWRIGRPTDREGYPHEPPSQTEA